MRLLSRILLTLAGGASASFVIAFLEVMSLVRRLTEGGTAPTTIRKGAFILADAGVLGPVTLIIAAAVAFGALVVEPPGTTTLVEDIVAVRAARARVRAAAITPIIVFLMFLITVGTGHAARFAVGYGAGPVESGFTMASASVAMTIASLAVALAVLPSLWKILARHASGTALTDPVVTGALLSVLLRSSWGSAS